MNYQDECESQYRKEIVKTGINTYIVDCFMDAFRAGFDCGSLNSASDNVKR